ncbi:MAG: N-acetylmannosamine-6-phosphate 2-epimerase [bacterium]
MNSVAQLKDGLIVSCQARPGEPLYDSRIMAAFALSAINGGAVGIRANTPADIRAIRAVTTLPIIGIYKLDTPESEVYITPTFTAAQEISDAGADIIALDATPRKRPGNETVATLIDKIHTQLQKPVMADISIYEEGIAAAQSGADLVSTTLSGYTPYSPQQPGPDLDLVRRLADTLKIPVVAEGKIFTPEELVAAFDARAYAVVIGSAITRPQVITARFVNAIKNLPQSH